MVNLGRWPRCCAATWAPTTRWRSYPDLLDHPALAEQTLRGYLNGSIDAVLRITDAAGSALSGGRLQDQLARRLRRGAADPGRLHARTGWPRP